MRRLLFYALIMFIGLVIAARAYVTGDAWSWVAVLLVEFVAIGGLNSRS